MEQSPFSFADCIVIVVFVSLALLGAFSIGTSVVRYFFPQPPATATSTTCTYPYSFSNDGKCFGSYSHGIITVQEYETGTINLYPGVDYDISIYNTLPPTSIDTLGGGEANIASATLKFFAQQAPFVPLPASTSTAYICHTWRDGTEEVDNHPTGTLRDNFGYYVIPWGNYQTPEQEGYSDCTLIQ